MDWYSLFVITGKEENVENWLRLYFQDSTQRMISLIPKRRLMERRAGKVNCVLKKMFPGYILINTEMNPEVYYSLKKIPYLIRILNSGEYYTRIAQEEMNFLGKLLGEGDVVEYSKVYLVNSKVVVKAGPLQGMEGLIKAVDKRKNRVKIMVPFMGSMKAIDIGIEVLDNRIDICDKSN